MGKGANNIKLKNFKMKMAAYQLDLSMSYLPAQAKEDGHSPRKLVKLEGIQRSSNTVFQMNRPVD